MILTSHEDMENTDSKTGVWLGEFTDPYYEFIDQGYSVVLASVAGGKPPVDPLSTLTENITASNRRFLNDKIAEMAFEDTRVLEDLNLATFDAVFYPGGHGPIWDLAVNTTSGNIILQFLDSGRPVAAVCHGPAALIAAATIRPGLLAGRKVVSFTNAEEVLTFRADNVPYKLETRLKELGADFHSALVPFIPHVEVDGLLITGQNPASAGPTAKALIEKLEAQTVSLH